MALPTLTIEMAFGAAPLALAPSWTDVSTYLRDEPGLEVERGRTDERGTFSAGRCRFRLSNRDRRFDPSHAAGPYVGQLVPRVRVRIRAVYSAVTYELFNGWIVGWPQSFDEFGLDAFVDLEAFDGLAWLQSTRLAGDPLFDYLDVTVGSLTGFLRQADDTKWVDQTESGYDAIVYLGRPPQPINGPAVVQGNPVAVRGGPNAPAGNSSTGARASVGSQVRFDQHAKWRMKTRWVAAGAWTVSFWITTTTSASLADQGIMGYSIASPATSANIYLTATTVDGAISWNASIFTGVTNAVAITTNRAVNDGLPHHVVITGTGSSGLEVLIYIDGENQPTTVQQSGNPALADFMGIEAIGNSTLDTGYAGISGTLQDIAFMDVALSPISVQILYDLSRGYYAETTTARAGRYLDKVGWPASWRALTTAPRGQCGELHYGGRSALTALQEVERTEQGRLCAAKDGNVTLLTRYHAFDVTRGKTVQATFGDTSSSIWVEDFGYGPGDLDVTNDVIVNTPTAHIESTDATSITNYGQQSTTVDTLLTSVQDAKAMATGLVFQRKTPANRTAPIACQPALVPANWPTIFGLELGDRIKYTVTPMNTGSQISQELTCEQIKWEIHIASGQWIFGINGSPIPPTFFVLGTGVLGTDTLGF